jgi:hypothetical protein
MAIQTSIGTTMKQFALEVNTIGLHVMLTGMHLRPVLVLILSLLPVGLDAQAPKKTTKPAPPRAERKVPYAVGERAVYDVSWSNYVSAGTVVLNVEAKRPSYNSTAYYIVAEARTEGVLASLYTLYYKADTLIDAFTMLPQRGSLFSREGRRQRMKTTTFDHARKKGSFEMQTASKMQKDVALDVATQDMLSALYALRTIAPRPGETFTMPVSDSGWLYQVTWTIGRPEAVKIASGQTVQALRVTPTIKDEQGKSVASTSVLWLATDGTFKPVRMEAALAVGRVVLALKQG